MFSLLQLHSSLASFEMSVYKEYLSVIKTVMLCVTIVLYLLRCILMDVVLIQLVLIIAPIAPSAVLSARHAKHLVIPRTLTARNVSVSFLSFLLSIGKVMFYIYVLFYLYILCKCLCETKWNGRVCLRYDRRILKRGSLVDAELIIKTRLYVSYTKKLQVCAVYGLFATAASQAVADSRLACYSLCHPLSESYRLAVTSFAAKRSDISHSQGRQARMSNGSVF